MTADTIIRIEGVWKRYGLPLGHLLRHYYSRLRRRYHLSDTAISAEFPWALQDIHLEVRQGDILGIVGRNGAGKSTLLKVLAGVSPPTKGTLDLRGQVFPMIELNAGIHPELTGRENTYLLGSIVGITHQDMKSRIQQIEEFCELGEWFDKPVRMYSSGMLVRLGFSVAIHVDHDILLVDEVLAVGDLSFRRKCLLEIEKRYLSNRTVILVSHDVRQIERLCNRAVFLEQGKILAEGQPIEVINAYSEFLNQLQLQTTDDAVKFPVSIGGTGDMIITETVFLDKKGNIITACRTGEPFSVKLKFLTTHQIEEPEMEVGWVSVDMAVIATFTNKYWRTRPSFEGEGWFGCRVAELPLLPGIYYLRVKINDKHGVSLFACNDVVAFHVLPESLSQRNNHRAGFVKVDVEWDDQPEYSPAKGQSLSVEWEKRCERICSS